MVLAPYPCFFIKKIRLTLNQCRSTLCAIGIPMEESTVRRLTKSPYIIFVYPKKIRFYYNILHWTTNTPDLIN